MTTHTLSYDGKGINIKSMEYSPRLATFSQSIPAEITNELGPVLASAPEMLAALSTLQEFMSNLMGKGNVDWGKTFGIDFGLMNESLIKMDKAIAKAEGRS